MCLDGVFWETLIVYNMEDNELGKGKVLKEVEIQRNLIHKRDGAL